MVGKGESDSAPPSDRVISRRGFIAASSLLGGAAVLRSANANNTMPVSHLFTPEELDHLATPLSIHMEREAKARSGMKLGWIQEQMDLECVVIYNSYLQWLAVLQSFIIKESNEAHHDQALRQFGAFAFTDSVLAYKGLALREHAEMLARRLRASGSTFWVEEDATKIRFRLDPWAPIRQVRKPSAWQANASIHRVGDRLYYPNTGEYEPPVSHAVLRGARDLTQSKDSLPCILATEIFFLEILPMELLGYPIAVVSLPKKWEEPVTLDIYKNMANIPVDVYARVGLAKPARGLPDAGPESIFTQEEREWIGTPLSLRVERAGEKNDWDTLLQISRGLDVELVNAKDPMGILIAGMLTWIARHFGEDAVERALVKTAEVVMAPYVETVRDLDIRDAIPIWAMVWRAHGSTFKIEEMDKAFIFRGRHLGACGRMWAHKYQTRVERISESRVRYPTFGVYDPPSSFHRMKSPRGITHGKTGYPIYSTHCHMLHEIYPIDQIGYPLWVEMHPLDDQDGETVHIHYKNPQDWPEEAYERVGRKKPAI